MAKKHKGLLISFEGMEGAGKTTQIELLKAEFEKKGMKALCPREPGGTNISEQIREVVLSPKNKEMEFTTEVLLFMSARAQLYFEYIIPALEKNKIVLCDRSSDSSLVYQGMVRGFGREKIENLNDLATGKTYPQLTFLLDIEPKKAFERILKVRELDRIEKEGIDFHNKVRNAYIQIAKENKGRRWIILDGEKSIEEVHEEVMEKVKEKVGNRF